MGPVLVFPNRQHQHCPDQIVFQACVRQVHEPEDYAIASQYHLETKAHIEKGKIK